LRGSTAVGVSDKRESKFLAASLEEPDALIALVRICGGRRPAFGPGGPIPEAINPCQGEL